MSSRVKILHVIRPCRGGAAHFLRMLLERADRARFDMAVVASPLEGEGYPRQLAGLGHRVYAVPIERAIGLGADWRALGRILQLVRAERPHLVHAHSSKPGVLARAAARLAGVPAVVYSPHGPYFQYDLSSAKRFFYRWAEKVAAAATEVILTGSDSERRGLLEAGVGDERRVVRIWNAVEAGQFEQLPAQAEARRELGLPQEGYVVGMIGRLEPPKDPMTFLRAAGRLEGGTPGDRLVVVGEGSLRGAIEAELERRGLQGKVVCTGFVPDLATAMAAVDVVVLSSRSEGLPYILMEAMAAGKPVVASRLKACEDLIEPGVQGLLFEVGDEGGLAASLARLRDDPQQRWRMGEAGRKRVRERHSPEGWIEQLESLYLTLVRKP